MKAISVNDLTKSAFLNRPDLHVETEGEFAGWRTWSRDNFETHNGPFWHRMEDDGQHPLRLPGREEAPQRHAQRPWRLLHAFADYCLFAIAAPVLQGPGVTVSFACEFLDAAREGELIEGTGEITRAGGSLIFLRGLLKSGERSLFTFSGTIKRVKRKPPDQSRCRCQLALQSRKRRHACATASPPRPGAAGAIMRCCWRWRAAGVRPIR